MGSRFRAALVRSSSSRERSEADYSAINGYPADLAVVVICGDTHDVEASVEGFQRRFRTNARSDSAGRAMLDVDRSPDGGFTTLAIRLKSKEGGCLHQANHVRRGIQRRQVGMVGGQGVLEFDGLQRFDARAYWDFFGHHSSLAI